MILKDLNEVVAHVRAEYRRWAAEAVESYRRRAEEAVRKIESNRAVLPELLDELGDDCVRLDPWDGETLTVDLGEKKDGRRAKAAFDRKLVALRDILGNLTASDKRLLDGRKKMVEVSLEAEAFPGVRIRYRTKLPKEAKCKVVKERVKARSEYSLVCEVG